jgi:shikimate kinase
VTVLVFAGPPGSGKTTIGRLVADRLGVDFLDTDTEIELLAGKPIPEIFVDDGEPAFRALEQQTVARALAEHTGVVALGGGAVLLAETRALLAEHKVVFLDVSVPDAVRRVGLSSARPLLSVNPRQRLRELMEQRRPLYEEVATVRVITDGRTPDEVAAEVLALAVPG